MHYSTCILPIVCRGAATRLIGNVSQTGNISQQTVIATQGGLVPLNGSDRHNGFEIGSVLELFKAPDPDEFPLTERQRLVPQAGLRIPIWDAWSSSLYAWHGYAIVRIHGDEVSLLAGSVVEPGDRDGPGRQARFDHVVSLASDGAGSIFCAGGDALCRIQLPEALHSSRSTTEAGGGTPWEAVVTTLPFRAAESIQGLTFLADPHGGSGSLVYATETALYRIQITTDDTAATSVLIAGREGEPGLFDGHSAEARFSLSGGLAVDGEGCIICTNMMPGFRETAVRRVTADGTVTTLAYGLDGQLCVPSILPNGYVLLCNNNIVGAHAGQPTLIDLGLKPQPLTQQRISPAAPATRTLASDLGALLDQPDGTSDIMLDLGEQSFRAHKTILAARSDYFKQRIAEGSGFADGAETQLSLPDANPEAFALVLRFMYTGAVDIPAPLACPVAELANRLLLPELTAAACSRVLASVTPLTVVDALMWAEVCVDLGGDFLQLFKDLKAWFVVNYELVASNPANSIERLDMKPALTRQLLAAYAERASKRPRLR